MTTSLLSPIFVLKSARGEKTSKNNSNPDPDQPVADLVDDCARVPGEGHRRTSYRTLGVESWPFAHLWRRSLKLGVLVVSLLPFPTREHVESSPETPQGL